MTQLVLNHLGRAATHEPVEAFVEGNGRLGAAIRAVRRGVSIEPVPSEIQQAAWQHLRAIEPHFAVAGEDHMLSWLVKLAPGVINAPTTHSDLRARAAATWELCAGLPRAVWSDETRREWLRKQPTGKFWPTAGELFAHLDSFAGALRSDRAGCEAILAIASKRAAEVVSDVPDAAQRDAVRHMLNGWRAEQADNRRADDEKGSKDRAPVPSYHLSPESLLRAYEEGERLGHYPSAHRAVILREQLAKARAASLASGGDEL